MNLELNVVRFENEDVIATSCQEEHYLLAFNECTQDNGDHRISVSVDGLTLQGAANEGIAIVSKNGTEYVMMTNTGPCGNLHLKTSNGDSISYVNLPEGLAGHKYHFDPSTETFTVCED